MIRDNLNMFITKNIYFAAHSSFGYSEVTLNNTKVKTALVTFLNENFSCQDFLKQANKIARYGERTSWLILANCHLEINIMDVLRHVNFGLDSDVVVAFDTSVNITSNQVIKNYMI
ncbi:unnamed protein product [Psylliodes chrysocephalus]|uniref:Uncharacterized protein n=1 Tax=Psylliodes chrysocephalus TaxID=3402493 RepID=A0A9P0G592_9CUCU|nr:unnamed protein product [Psylliodes chrysocephala]